MPDQTLALELAVRSVETAIDLLVRADHAYTAQATKRWLLNEECVAVARNEVYPELVDVRRALDTRFGRDFGGKIHRIEGHTCRKPKRLFPQLARVVMALKYRRKFPDPVRPGPPGEREHWLQQLKPGHKKLKAMLKELQQREIWEVALRQDRDFELESFDLTYGESLAFVRSVFQLSGQGQKIIWGLLPTVRRRRLKRKARQEGEARAEGRRTPGDESSNVAPNENYSSPEASDEP